MHLHPNSILILAIFAYLCEAYLGVMPSVAFFRSFYALRNTAPGERSGCVSFRITDGMKGVYIPIARNGEEIVTSVTKKVEDFRKRWFLMQFGSQSAFFELPEAPPTKRASWSSKALKGASLGPVVRRLKDLREAGLTGQMVAKDFVRRRIAPLQKHADAMWLYSNQGDKMRLSATLYTKEELHALMETSSRPQTSPRLPTRPFRSTGSILGVASRTCRRCRSLTSGAWCLRGMSGLARTRSQRRRGRQLRAMRRRRRRPRILT